MESKWLEDFLALALHKNFCRAAEARNITQSALSRRIKLLEGWMGAPLIERRTNPISLTEAGEKFLPRAEEMYNMILSVRDELRAPYMAAQEVLTVCMMSTLSITTFPRLVAQLEQRGEQFRFRFADSRTTMPDWVELLRSGNADFLLTYAHSSVAVLNTLNEFEYLTVGTERCIPVSVPGTGGRPRYDLTQQDRPVDYLSYRNHSFFANALPGIIKRGGFRLNTVYENALSAALLAAVRVGLGVAWIPEKLLEDDLATGRLLRAATPEYDLLVDVRLYRPMDDGSRIKNRFWRKLGELSPLQ
ncbi:LysR family transcriptional regulator (plasmid) [Ketogulonicigenium vulgare Y25]|uniref:LysR family transcriptional regulator n=1 Tax=Ketogulonicigenium vulgare TaxID=92945 RepID=UPI0001E67308|nr:LysR family transcriptional regulator [Ketogulonicigenium vulgare]ADO44364.1 LysR family transcriptional regulator [Ketogulonicigenium vulgare Y25]ALJ82770.1 LysR family transcriptional regulator [Ketogulonicigenium vulgare]